MKIALLLSVLAVSARSESPLAAFSFENAAASAVASAVKAARTANAGASAARARPPQSKVAECDFAPELARRGFSLTLTPVQGEPAVTFYKYDSCHTSPRDDNEPAYTVRYFKGDGEADLLIVTFDVDAGQDPHGNHHGMSDLVFVSKGSGSTLGRFKNSSLLAASPLDLGLVSIVKLGAGRGFIDGWTKP